MSPRKTKRFAENRDGERRILGIDPGYDRCGVALITCGKERPALICSSSITTKKTVSIHERLFTVGKELARLIETLKPNALAVESLFFAKNTSTAGRVYEIRGIAIFLAQSRGIPVLEIHPQTVKLSTTGYGKASKGQVSRMIDLMFQKKSRTPRYDDEYDAIAIALSAGKLFSL